MLRVPERIVELKFQTGPWIDEEDIRRFYKAADFGHPTHSTLLCYISLLSGL